MDDSNDSTMKPYYGEYFKKKHPQLFAEAEIAKGIPDNHVDAVLNEVVDLLAEQCEKKLGIKN